jgi:hypothetical protein
VIGNREVHIGCGSLFARKIKILINSKHILKVKHVKVFGHQEENILGMGSESDATNSLILQI